jgi:Chalcone isomerase-like
MMPAATWLFARMWLLWLMAPAFANPAHASVAPASTAMPPEVRALGETAQLQGGTRFRYWGFLAYDIQLWALPAFDAQQFTRRPLALSITYARSIALQDLVERSLKEIERQGPIAPTERQAWAQVLTRAWRDVRPGDRITGVYQPPQRLQFYLNGQPTGTVDEASLAPRFIAIWLGPQTSQPGLREALLGMGPQGGVVHGW